jgi:hypothetical protein
MAPRSRNFRIRFGEKLGLCQTPEKVISVTSHLLPRNAATSVFYAHTYISLIRGYSQQAHRMCNTYCFPAATVLMRMRRDVAFMLLSCIAVIMWQRV